MKTLIGNVVSTKMNKTIVVEVMHERMHPIYKKIMKRHVKIKAHCEDDTVKEGETVEIKSSKPISKQKSFIFVKKIKV